MLSACGRQLGVGAPVVGQGSRIFVTVSRHVGSSNGTVPASTWGENCRSSQPTLGHVDVGHTYWYIEAVPELLQLATERLGRASARR